MVAFFAWQVCSVHQIFGLTSIDISVNFTCQDHRPATKGMIPREPRPVNRCDQRERTEPARSSRRDPGERTPDYDPTAASSGVAAEGRASSSQAMSTSPSRGAGPHEEAYDPGTALIRPTLYSRYRVVYARDRTMSLHDRTEQYGLNRIILQLFQLSEVNDGEDRRNWFKVQCPRANLLKTDFHEA